MSRWQREPVGPGAFETLRPTVLLTCVLIKFFQEGRTLMQIKYIFKTHEAAASNIPMAVFYGETLQAWQCRWHWGCLCAFSPSLLVVNFSWEKFWAGNTMRHNLNAFGPVDLDHFFKQRCSVERRGRAKSGKPLFELQCVGSYVSR